MSIKPGSPDIITSAFSFAAERPRVISLPMSIIAYPGKRMCENLTPRRPVVRTILSAFLMSSSFISPRCSFHGSTKPVVPRIDIPPVMPTCAFSVFFAICSPSGTDISMHAPLRPVCAIASFTASSIWRMGDGFIAGMPFFEPIPLPALIMILSQTLAIATISIPPVASEAWSPGSLIAEAFPLFAMT